MKVAFALIALLLAGCGSGKESAGETNDAVLKEAIDLERRTNEAVNQTIAEIETENRQALNLQSASDTKASKAAADNVITPRN